MTQTVLITGATSGFGAAAAKRFAEAGWQVIATGRRAERLQPLVEEFGAQRVHAAAFDLRDEAALEAALSALPENFRGIDVLVNNAGLGGETPVADMTDEQWDRVLDITLTSTFRATRAALRYFKSVDHNGVLVNNASVLGWRAQHSQAHYAAAKAGVMALTRCSAIEAAEYGVRINAVAPSIARHAFLAKVTSEELLDKLAESEAFGRAAEVWEIAATIAMLASDYTTYLTGEIVSISSQRA